jgi:hypothetical protein
MAHQRIILFSPEEWRNCLDHVTGKDRKQFKKSFDGIISKKLQENGINCWLQQR